MTRWRMSECIASAARSARYSLANPRPTDATTITPMMAASTPWPTKAETAAAASRSHSRGLFTCRANTDKSAGVMGAHSIRAERFGTLRHPGGAQPGRAGPEQLEHVLGRHGRGRLDRWERPGVETRRRGERDARGHRYRPKTGTETMATPASPWLHAMPSDYASGWTPTSRSGYSDAQPDGGVARGACVS